VRIVKYLVAGVIVLVAAACGQSNATTDGGMPRAIVDPYLKIHAALSADSVEGVSANAVAIAEGTHALGAPAIGIETAARQLASAADLADARAKFGALNDAVDAYMTGQHVVLPEGVRVAYCPMVKKSWLQEGSSIANPYYGKSMFSCGAFR
jgi:hypothetical protein